MKDNKGNIDYISIMFCMPRSGGSLLNRSLGMLPNSVVLSEVFPSVNTGEHSVKYQARQWYDIELDGVEFVECVIELYEYCKQNSKKLIIRDHTYLNFFKNFNYLPTSELLVLSRLDGLVPIKTFAFIRDPIDAWISHSNEVKHLKSFFLGFNNFLELIDKYGVKIFKYEDFVNDPIHTMRGICKHCDLNYSNSFKEQRKFKNYLGDSNNRGRGLQYSNIVVLYRKLIHPYKILKINFSKEIKIVNNKLGYSTNYFGRKIEKININHLKRILEKLKLNFVLKKNKNNN